MEKEVLFCDHCGKRLVDEEARMEEDEIFEEDKNYGITEQTCLECREEVREAIEEFEGDYSPMHPNETRQEFEEHEDHEARI